MEKNLESILRHLQDNIDAWWIENKDRCRCEDHYICEVCMLHMHLQEALDEFWGMRDELEKAREAVVGGPASLVGEEETKELAFQTYHEHRRNAT